MKFSAFLVPALTVLASAAPIEKQKQVIVSYPNETPNWVIDQAMQAVRDGGGIVTNQFELIKYAISGASANHYPPKGRSARAADR